MRGVARAVAAWTVLASFAVRAADPAPDLASSPVPSVAAGQALYDRGDVAGAAQIWEPLARAGDARAAFDMGLVADLGRLGKPDPGEALRWYGIAASRGDAQAAFNVGVMLDSGQDGPRDVTAAATWYAEAAARGHARAAFNLGQLYEAGTGVPRNSALARAWFRVAAGRGVPAAARAVADPTSVTANLSPPNPIAPAGDVTSAGMPPGVVLVWTCPDQPARTRFFAQVLDLGVHPARQVFAGYTDVSALLAPLPSPAARYAWRVYATDPAGHYVPGAWQGFSTRP